MRRQRSRVQGLDEKVRDLDGEPVVGRGCVAKVEVDEHLERRECDGLARVDDGGAEGIPAAGIEPGPLAVEGARLVRQTTEPEEAHQS